MPDSRRTRAWSKRYTDDVEPASNSTDEQNTQDSTDSASTATSGIIETAGAHAPVLDEATPDITDEGKNVDLTQKTFVDYGVEEEITQALADKGIDQFVEFGPGKILTGLIKRIAPQAQLHNVSDAASLQSTLAKFS